ncbi:MAG: putative PEP-binding protein [Cyanobacteria bacterium P01_A01_bin.83]
MTYIYWLSQIQYSEQSLVGDKLFILSQLLQRGYPVGSGFVIGSNLWRELIVKCQDRLIDKNFGDDYQLLQSVANHNWRVINQAALPPTWQSELFTAAKQLDSSTLILQPVIANPQGQLHQINGLYSFWRSQTCNTHPDAISTALKLVWSELFTASSLLYWQKLGLDLDKIDLSVLVRPLNHALASGIIEITPDVIQIKASWGLVDSLLQGDVEADTYIVDPETSYILSQSIGHKNYGYRPRQQDSEIATIDCLEAYIPHESLASTYVLDDQAIAQLIQLTQNILKQQPQLKSLVWTAFESPSTQLPNFYFTWFDDELSEEIFHKDNLTIDIAALPSATPLASGVVASPGKVQAKLVVIPDLAHHTQLIPAGSILVTKILNPQHISLIKHTGGIITEMGGKTSHAAIVARELNIPALVDVTEATKILRHGDQVYLDGSEGHVYAADIALEFTTSHSWKRLSSPRYPIATKLMVNLSQPESIATASNLAIDGVGLLRSELMLAGLLATPGLAKWQDSFRSQFLSTLTDYLRQFASAFAPRPVFYRSLDRYGADLSDSVLGNRGTYNYFTDSSLFDLELEALSTLVTEGHTNLKLILPFVRSVEEFEFCLRRIETTNLTSINSFQVWIMAEVPSVIMLLPEYIAAGVQGIAIGTNDLTQLLLGVNREQTQFSDRGLNANHPAMHKAISKLIQTAKEHGISCCVCGQAPVEHPDLIDFLVRWGVDGISVEPEALTQTHKAIARAERRFLLEKVRKNQDFSDF